MAVRLIFVPSQGEALVDETQVSFEWFPGFARSQKQRSVDSLHKEASKRHGLGNILEVSTSSRKALGVRLSAFNLRVELAGYGPRPLEVAYQGSKVLQHYGSCQHLYDLTSARDAKRQIGDLSSEALVGFRYLDEEWPIEPITAFYDWLYLSALKSAIHDAPQIEHELLQFDGFTDIAFNPAKSLNCQARSCALYVSLLKRDRLHDALADRDAFLAVLDVAVRYGYGPTLEPNVSSQEKLL